jgi:hemin uptake protein HemP
LNAHNRFELRGAEPQSPGLRPVAIPGPAIRTISSKELFGGEQEIVIDHRGSLYRLKITRQGKLILNK